MSALAASIALAPDLIDTLVNDAAAAGDREICGFVIAGRDGVLRAHPVTNVAAEPRTRFDMDPAEQIAVFKRLREPNHRLVAIYHSHPSGAATPSRHDIAGHHYPDALLLIAAPQAEAGARLRAWRLCHGAVQEVAIG